jgi:large subunit ribosomal protein L17e
MTKYSNKTLDAETKVAKASGSHLRIHYKHCREICDNISGMSTEKALIHMNKVINFEAGMTFTKHTGGIGHKAQGKNCTKGRSAPGNAVRWPVKATKVVVDMLKNAIANAEAKSLDVDNLVIAHIQANRAPGGRRRTYRAHGRIGPYKSEPAHIQMILIEKPEKVAKGEAEPISISRKQAAKNRFVKVGGGAN